MKKLILIISVALLLVSCSKSNYPAITQSAFYPEMYNTRPLTLLIMPVINRTTNPINEDFVISANAQMLSERGYYVIPSSIIHNIMAQDSLECFPDIDPAPCHVFHDRFGIDALMFIAVKNWQRDFGSSALYEEFEYSLVSSSTGKELWYYDIFVAKSREVQAPESSEGNNIMVDLCCGIFGSLFASAVATALTSYNLTAEQACEISLKYLPAGKYNSRYMLDSMDHVKVNTIWKNQSFGNRLTVEDNN